jgi:hypothetical protein
MFDEWRLIAPDDDADRIEPAGQPGPTVALEPEAGDSLDLPAFPGGDRFQGVAVARTGTGLDLDERDEIVAPHDEVDLAVTETEVPRQNRVAVLAKVPGGEALAQDPQVTGWAHVIGN